MALVITTSQRVKVKISKKSKTDQTTKNLGLKKRDCIRIQHLLFLLFFGIPVRGRHKPTTAQAHPSTEHGWKNPAILGQPPENQTLCFAFAETSNWNTIFFISPDIFSQLVGYVLSECTCWQWAHCILATKVSHWTVQCPAFTEGIWVLPKTGQFTQSISAHSLVPQTFGRKSPFSATKIYLSLSDKITTESSSLKTWESEHSPKKVTSVLKWCFETCKLLRDENHHTSVHWATLFF